MVAPSFQTYKVIVAEPFYKDGKLYITVEHPNTKNHRDVRWYSEREYARAYGNKSKNEAKVIIPKGTKIFYKPAAARLEEVSGTNPRVIKAKVGGDPRIAKVLLWEAYGAMLEEKRG